jgi:integrase
VASKEHDGARLGTAVDAFLSSSRLANPNTRRAYAAVLDRVLADLGSDRALVEVPGDDLAEVLETTWGGASPATWNRNRAAVSSFLAWCAKNPYPAPVLPPSLERRAEHPDETKALPRGAIERQLSRRDVPLREKTLWRMLYETAARASEVLALDVTDLDLDGRRAKVISKGGATEWAYWSSGTAHLLPRLLQGRSRGPVFVSERRPGPGRRPPARDFCPDTGQARLGYDRARVVFKAHTGWALHQLRHSAATHLGEKNVPLQAIMAKTRHRNPRHRHALHQARARSRRRGHRAAQPRPTPSLTVLPTAVSHGL